MKRTQRFELESKLLYAMIVAGKSADFTDKALGRFLALICGQPDLRRRQLPLKILRGMSKRRIMRCLVAARTGNYGKLARGFFELSRSAIDPETATPPQLERVHGIGPKTSRFFVIWSRPRERYAALDVHVLRWLAGQGHDVPRQTPTGQRYAAIERLFMAEADKRGLTPRELDSLIWEAGAGRTQEKAVV